MLRALHSIPALIATLLLLVVALGGAALSIFPTLERMQAPAEALDVATLAGHVSARVPGVETIVRRPSGMIVAYSLANGGQQASVIDPATGEALAPYQPSATQRWLRNLHRKLLLSGNAGRIAVGIAAALMLFGSVLIVAVNGMHSIDRKRAAKDPEGWSRYAAVTSILPFAAIAAGRNRFAPGEIGWGRLGLALGLWILFVLLHPLLLGVAALPA